MRALVLLLLVLMGAAFPAAAHEGRPLLIRLSDQDGITRMTWQTPPVVPAHAEPLVLIDNCDALDPPIHGLLGQARFDCSDAAAPAQLRIVWPSINPALSTLVELEGGATRFYGPEVTEIPLAALTGGEADLTSFIETGVEHILSGYDHLLFILGLTLLILRGPADRKGRRLTYMVTGFTLAHSITLGLAVFNVIALPAPPVEAVIALSVLFVGLELARNDKTTLTWRYPALTASAFGLLHGLGFASILANAGLADDRRLLGLFGFNIGVELGQLAFVALIVIAGFAARAVLQEQQLARLQTAAALLIGAVSVSWMLERVIGFWG